MITAVSICSPASYKNIASCDCTSAPGLYHEIAPGAEINFHNGAGKISQSAWDGTWPKYPICNLSFECFCAQVPAIWAELWTRKSIHSRTAGVCKQHAHSCHNRLAVLGPHGTPGCAGPSWHAPSLLQSHSCLERESTSSGTVIQHPQAVFTAPQVFVRQIAPPVPHHAAVQICAVTRTCGAAGPCPKSQQLD